MHHYHNNAIDEFYLSGKACILMDCDIFNKTALKKAIDALEQGFHSIQSIHYFGRNIPEKKGTPHKRKIHYINTPTLNKAGKNAADIALAIQATNLAREKDLQLFVLVVSDSDYTPLVSELTRLGKRVWIVGNHTTPPYLRLLAERFICYTDQETKLKTTPPIITLIRSVENASDKANTTESEDPPWIAVKKVKHHLHKINKYYSYYNTKRLYSLLKRYSRWFETIHSNKQKLVRIKDNQVKDHAC